MTKTNKKSQSSIKSTSTKSNSKSASSTKKSKSKSSTSTIKSHQHTTVIIDDGDEDEDADENDPNYETEKEDSGNEKENENDDNSFESTVSPIDGKRNRRAEQNSSKKKKPATKSKKGNYKLPNNVDPDQDSDIEEVPAPNSSDAPAEVYNHVKLYFESELFCQEDEQQPGEKPMYRICLFCPKSYRIGERSNWNLTGHRDGDANRTQCAGRADAIAAGANLPFPWKARQAAKVAAQEAEKHKHEKASLQGFLNLPKFSVGLLYMILVLWFPRNCIPWLRMEDPYLQAAFALCNPNATLWSASWSARREMEYFEEFRGNLVQTLKGLDSKICVIHDVWTTK